MSRCCSTSHPCFPRTAAVVRHLQGAVHVEADCLRIQKSAYPRQSLLQFARLLVDEVQEAAYLVSPRQPPSAPPHLRAAQCIDNQRRRL
eukprot:355645-Chlamydomonas_euryale.AAC.32